MTLFPGAGEIVPEPHWRMLLNDDIEVQSASSTAPRHRRDARAKLALAVERTCTLAPGDACVLFDRSLARLRSMDR
jgi:hypothetical protein